MATQEQYPKSDNDSATQEQIPHSGVGGYEQPPARQFDNTTLPEAVAQGLIETPTSPAPLMPPAEVEMPKRSWKKPAAAGALALTVLAGAFGIGRATSGNDTEPRVEPSVGAPANPGEIAPNLTEAQQERANLEPRVANEAMLPTSYYDEGGETDLSGIDMVLLENNLDTLLDNIVYMQETGDFSIMNKTFLEDSDGNYPGAAAEVEGVKANYQLNEATQATNPNQPISSMQVEGIQSVIPAGFETVEVTAAVSFLGWGNPTSDKLGNAFSSVHTTRYTLQAQETPIEGSEATENIWLILHEEAVN